MKKNKKRVTIQILKGIFLFIMFAMIYWYSTRPQFKATLTEINTPLPLIQAQDFVVQTEGGKNISLSHFKGKPILLNFWASWCPPCVEELPELLKFSQWAKVHLDLQVIAVSVDENWEPVNKLLRSQGIWAKRFLPMTFLLDPAKEGVAFSAKLYGTSQFPETFFIDRKFNVVQKFIGPERWMSREILEWMVIHSR